MAQSFPSVLIPPRHLSFLQEQFLATTTETNHNQFFSLIILSLLVGSKLLPEVFNFFRLASNAFRDFGLVGRIKEAT